TLGVKTVVNLRHFHGDTERERVEKAGLRYVHIPLESSDKPTVGAVAAFLKTATDPSLRPMYVHCQHGVDRTGTMMALYRMEVEGWKNDEAFAEMVFFGAHRIWQDLRAYVRAYK